MFSKREATEPKAATSKRMALIVFVAIAVGGAFAYVAPAATTVDRAVLDERPGIASNATSTPWAAPSAEAVDSAGIEKDLDGNASALFASDQWCGLPPCGHPRQP